MSALKPTDSELEILQVLWSTGPATVRDVNERLAAEKDSAIGYTTTLKLMQIMVEKNILERDASAKTHIYKAVLSEASARRTMLDKMIDTVFKGSAADLVMHALSHKPSSDDELRQIRELLNRLDPK